MTIGTKVFDNATTNQASPDYYFEGDRIQVDIFGVLDGADVSTYVRGANNQPFRLRTCSWLTSDQDTLYNAGMGYEYIYKSVVFFLIENAGASTNISLNVAPGLTPVPPE